MLKLINIHKCFAQGTSHETNALRGIKIHINEGDFLTVIGSNGAGNPHF